jgi:hypothetical protein
MLCVKLLVVQCAVFWYEMGPDNDGLMVLGPGHVPISVMQQQIVACQECWFDIAYRGN